MAKIITFPLPSAVIGNAQRQPNKFADIQQLLNENTTPQDQRSAELLERLISSVERIETHLVGGKHV